MIPVFKNRRRTNDVLTRLLDRLLCPRYHLTAPVFIGDVLRRPADFNVRKHDWDKTVLRHWGIPNAAMVPINLSAKIRFWLWRRTLGGRPFKQPDISQIPRKRGPGYQRSAANRRKLYDGK